MSSENLKLTLPEMTERFRFLGSALGPTVFAAMLVSAAKMRRDVVSLRLSGPRGAPGILGVVTGAARRSIADEAGVAGDTVYALFGSALEYVKAWEDGFHGDQEVRAHTRRRLGAVRAVSIAQATRGKVIKRARQSAAQRKAGLINVKAHQRKANMEAKHFIRDTLLAAKGPTEARIMRALIIAAETGKPPVASQLGG